jgi:hypothetical protein
MVTPLCPMASRIAETSPPGSTMAPSFRASSKTSEQFCRKGVTGMMKAWSFVMAGVHSCVAQVAQLPCPAERRRLEAH